MREDRLSVVKGLLFDFVKSPSLRHIRDPHSLTRLAEEIVRRIDLGNSIWRKWSEQRELLLKSALCCWIPNEDMWSFLNSMPGPALTRTDVAQRMRAFEDEEYFSLPNEELRSGCLAIYYDEAAPIYAVYAYGKNQRADLSAEQRKAASRFIAEIKQAIKAGRLDRSTT